MGSNGDMVLIQRYLEGRLSPGEMHDFEKRVLDDPFLADALEGYAYTRVDASHQLSLLQRRLGERIARAATDKNRFYFGWQRLSVAAAAGILFIAAGILFWMKANPPGPQHNAAPGAVEVKMDPSLKNWQKAPAKKDSAEKTNPAPAKPAPVQAQPRKKGKRMIIAAVITPKERSRGDFEDFVGGYQGEPKKTSVDLGAAYVVSNAQQYRSYLQQALKKPADSLNYKGMMPLSFKVGTAGELREVAIDPQKGRVMSDALLKAMTAGPSWTPGEKVRSEEIMLDFR